MIHSTAAGRNNVEGEDIFSLILERRTAKHSTAEITHGMAETTKEDASYC